MAGALGLRLAGPRTYGATRVEDHADLGVHWAVMRDPEGNEFCV